MISTAVDSKIRPFNISKNVISEKIRKIMAFLAQPLSERSNYVTHQISLYLIEYPFFARFESSGILIELMKHLTVEVFPLGSVIIPWTATQSNFFLILTGRIGQYRRDDKGFDQGREYLSGSYFGEKGISGDILNEEYRSLETSQLMVLEKNIFEKVLSNIQKERYDEQYEFFSSIPVFKNLPKKALAHLSKVALTKKFAPNSLIAKQNDRVRGFYILHSGSAKLLRNVNIEQFRESLTRIVEVDEVESGGIICEYAFIHQEPLEYSVLCNMPTVAYFIDKDYFRGQNQVFLTEIEKIADKIPNDVELSMKFKQKVSWIKYKEVFMDSLKIRKKRLALNRVGQSEKIKLPLLKRIRNLSV